MDIMKLKWIILIALFFLIFNLFNLPNLSYNLDEGMYLYQAEMINSGKIPYKDFFIQQTPFFPYLLSPPISLFTDPYQKMMVGRFISLFFTFLTGLLVFKLAERFTDKKWAAVSVLFFYFIPLQYYGKLILPEASMIFFSVLSVYLIFFKNKPIYTIISGILLFIAIFIKPLAISTFIVLFLFLLLKKQKKKLTVFCLSFILSLIIFSGFLNYFSEGSFNELLLLQLNRLGTHSGFNTAMNFRSFNHIIKENNIGTPLLWNIYEHKSTFFVPFPTNLNFYPLLISIITSLILIYEFYRNKKIKEKLFLVFWLFVSFLFMIFVWEPTWDHYFLQYLPPISILSAMFIKKFEKKKIKNYKKIIFLILITFLALSLLNQETDFEFYREIDKMKKMDCGFFSFNPFISFLLNEGKESIIKDPLNQYSEVIVPFSKGREHIFNLVRDEDIIKFVKQNPEYKIIVDKWFDELASENLTFHLFFETDFERFIFLEESDCKYNSKLPICKFDLKNKIMFENNWFDEEIYDNMRYRWMSNNATLLIYNQENKNKEIELSFEVRSLAKERDLEIYFNNELKEKIQVPDYEWFGEKKSTLINLKPGFNEIKLHSVQECQIPEIIKAWQGDMRCLTFSFKDINIERL